MTGQPVRRYFDNAATSFPKPPGVAAAMLRVLTEVGGPGRGAYAEARESGRVIRTCRERIAKLVNLEGGRAENVIFGYNTTDALNLAIKGALLHARRREPTARLHVVTTSMEHNSVLRPMNALMQDDPNLSWSRVDADPATGVVDPADIRQAVLSARASGHRVALVIVNHASNVLGTLQDLPAIADTLADLGVGSNDPDAPLFLVDGAQSLGHVPFDMHAWNVDLLAFPGHKGLLGPTGTGGLCIRPGVEHRLATIREGGTGSSSEIDTHPDMMPEKFEAGSHNAVGIAGLSEGVAWLLAQGVEKIREHEQALLAQLLPAFESGELPGVRLLGFGAADAHRRVGVLTFLHDALDAAELSALLESGYGILSRAGLHCAPHVHKPLGTAPPEGRGATRLSLGPFLTQADVAYALESLTEVCNDHTSRHAQACGVFPRA